MPRRDSREQQIYILARDAALTASLYYGQDVRWGETEEEFRRLPTWRLQELIEGQRLKPRKRGRPRKSHKGYVEKAAVDLVAYIGLLRRRSNSRLSIAGACSCAVRWRYKGVSEMALRKRYYDACKKLGLDPQAT
jgi:hypothetical protein